MTTTSPISEINRELARKINEEALRDPKSPYANKFVGIANGHVVVLADNWSEMSRKLRQFEPDPKKCFGLEASRDGSELHEVWGLCFAFLNRFHYGNFADPTAFGLES